MAEQHETPDLTSRIVAIDEASRIPDAIYNEERLIARIEELERRQRQDAAWIQQLQDDVRELRQVLRDTLAAQGLNSARLG